MKEFKDETRDVLEVAVTLVFLEREGLAVDKLEAELARLKGHLKGKFEPAKSLVSKLKEKNLFSCRPLGSDRTSSPAGRRPA